MVAVPEVDQGCAKVIGDDKVIWLDITVAHAYPIMEVVDILDDLSA
jgi:hypothetical protein